MSELNERVEREFKKWQEKYEIPFQSEFQVKTLLKLQDEYNNVEEGSNTTRTRETLLRMINEVGGSVSLKPKQEYNETILVIGNNERINLFLCMLDRIVPRDNVSYVVKSSSQTHPRFELFNGIKFIFAKSDELARGIRFDYKININ
jgi:hypothetical protein